MVCLVLTAANWAELVTEHTMRSEVFEIIKATGFHPNQKQTKVKVVLEKENEVCISVLFFNNP